MNRLSKILPAAAVFASAAAVPATAQQGESFPVEGNIGVTSNYVFRGVSQTGDDPAVQGGLDYAHDSGLYVGTWTSNVNFAGGTELDVYGGYSGSAEEFGYDLGVIGYLYPEADGDANFAEVYLGLSYDMLSAGVAYTFTSEIDNGAFSDGDIYVYGSGGFDLADDFSVGLTVGYYAFDSASGSDYVHGQLDLTKSTADYGDFTFSVSLADESDLATDDPLFFVSWGTGF
jgi:uncharacterized protein (TIGR02001 family)